MRELTVVTFDQYQDKQNLNKNQTEPNDMLRFSSKCEVMQDISYKKRPIHIIYYMLIVLFVFLARPHKSEDFLRRIFFFFTRICLPSTQNP